MKKTVVLILGGGQGKRLFPLTRDRAKPAVPIGGKYRLIDIPISNCLNSELKNIFVLTQFNSASLNNHVSQAYKFDYFTNTSVAILAAEQTLENANWFQGTADAVRKNLVHLNIRGDEDILILSGDHLYSMDYKDIVEFHRKSSADLTLSIIPVKIPEAKEFGVIRVDKNSRITSFREKPKTKDDLKGFVFNSRECFASMGVYVFKANILIKSLGGNYLDFGKQLIPDAITKYKSFGFIFNGYWKDIGTIKSFYEANIELTKKNPPFSFFNKETGWRVYSRPRFLEPAKIENVKINNAFITEGAFIKKAKIKNSIIGLRSIINENCDIQNSIIMGADYYEKNQKNNPIAIGIGMNSTIKKAIVDKNARIGKNVRIINKKNLINYDGENYFIRDRVVIIPKNSIIKDGTVI